MEFDKKDAATFFLLLGGIIFVVLINIGGYYIKKSKRYYNRNFAPLDGADWVERVDHWWRLHVFQERQMFTEEGWRCREFGRRIVICAIVFFWVYFVGLGVVQNYWQLYT